MGQKVIIVHPAELVRRGLVSALEDLQRTRIISVATFAEVRSEDYKAAAKLLLLVPVTCHHTSELLELRTKIGDHLFIGILLHDKEKYKTDHFDKVLRLDAPARQLREIAERFFEQDDTGLNDELTAREKEVLRLIALGNTNKTIAESLFISTHTVISHRKNITEKLGIKSIPGLTVYAIIQKIVAPTDISADQLS
ncbi:LuxR C-terminal-related transcriptional regulator [Maribellus sp. YY47]|uniref:helix-turn-helix transcriptional regulator n=1 Tax=Maribellus sp. YY47 TaxID=2929486 RepID=UPI002494B37A|nr:LuxR C-terminal-related transcriptional regulator [Maribellus sp. YY47]